MSARLALGVLLALLAPALALAERFQELSLAAADGLVRVESCPGLAAGFGELVEKERTPGADRARLLALRELGSELHDACREGIRVVELETGEEEAALEALYRSTDWYEVNRALASLRYWQAWLDLSLAVGNSDADARVTELSRARRGFEAAALRILYPGLVYGSWLGLAYVDQAEGRDAQAGQRLELLAEALASDPDNPLLKIVERERQLMQIRSGRLLSSGDIDVVDQMLTPSTARVAEEQAFALLARHREEEVGAIEAARLLRGLIAQGYLDDRLFARMLEYQEEIVGQDLGVVSRLLEAEFAYAYQQYETNVLKIRAFVAAGGESLPLRLDLFLYHYAASLYQIDLVREAGAVVEGLSAVPDLPAELRDALHKLDFIVADALYRDRPDEARAQHLRKAALAFAAAVPGDPDVPGAWLALARIEEDETLRARYLERASGDERLRESIRVVELDTAVANLTQALEQGDSSRAESLAVSALDLLDSFPRERRESLQARVLAVQLHSVIQRDPQATLEEIAKLRDEPGLTATQARVLAWSELRLLARREGALVAFVSALPKAGTDAAVDHELYAYLRELQAGSEHSRLSELSRLWLPKLSPQPPLHRQVWLMRIEARRQSGDPRGALDDTRKLLEAYPDSGDAWRALAEQSEQAGDLFGAERAWAHIAATEADGSPLWLEVSMRRLQLLAQLDGADRGCALQRRVAVYNHRLEAQDQTRVREFADECSR